MKIFKLLLVMSAAIVMSLTSCGKNDYDGPIYGTMLCDGKMLILNDIYYDRVQGLYGLTQHKMLILYNRASDQDNNQSNYSFALFVPDPYVDFETEVSIGSGIRFSKGDTFYDGDLLNDLSGKVKWTAGENSAKVEFNLTLEDGKKAKAWATIPNSVFKE